MLPFRGCITAQHPSPSPALTPDLPLGASEPSTLGPCAVWMPLALATRIGPLCAPSSSNGVTPVNHSQAWAYGRPAQKELLGNKFPGTSDPVNTVSESADGVFFFFFFSFKESFPGSKAITEES